MMDSLAKRLGSPLYQGEAMLLRWGETSATGPNVTLQLEDVEAFKALPWGKTNGQRFMAVLVAIDDHEEPVSKEQVEKNGPAYGTAEWAIKKAHTIVRDAEFKEWLHPGCTDSDWAYKELRSRCGVDSAADFKTNPKALEEFKRLMTSYEYRDRR